MMLRMDNLGAIFDVLRRVSSSISTGGGGCSDHGAISHTVGYGISTDSLDVPSLARLRFEIPESR